MGVCSSRRPLGRSWGMGVCSRQAFPRVTSSCHVTLTPSPTDVKSRLSGRAEAHSPRGAGNGGYPIYPFSFRAHQNLFLWRAGYPIYPFSFGPTRIVSLSYVSPHVFLRARLKESHAPLLTLRRRPTRGIPTNGLLSRLGAVERFARHSVAWRSEHRLASGARYMSTSRLCVNAPTSRHLRDSALSLSLSHFLDLPTFDTMQEHAGQHRTSQNNAGQRRTTQDTTTCANSLLFEFCVSRGRG
jgi:hypothetical protein